MATQAKRRIGILTGGGDVPGLNSVIKSVVYWFAEFETEYEIVGFRRGWEGLTHLRLTDGEDPKYLVRLDRQNTRTIDRTGGTWLHTSRTNPTRMVLNKLPDHVKDKVGEEHEVVVKDKSGTDQIRHDVTHVVLSNLEQLGVDSLIAIGGDDTLSYAAVLNQHGFPVVAVPKTMDNDVRNTEYCIGFSTAMTRAVESINRLRSTVGSHERIGLLRIFGRDAGFTAMCAAYVTSLRCCIPEHVFDLDRLMEMLMDDKRDNPSNYAMLLLSEGATWEGRTIQETGKADAYGHRRKISVAEALSDEIEGRTGHDTLIADLTYELRSGEPDFLDRTVGISFASMACQCILDGQFGRMTAIRDGCFDIAEIPDPKLGPRQVDVETMYNIQRYRPYYTAPNGFPIFRS